MPSYRVTVTLIIFDAEDEREAKRYAEAMMRGTEVMTNYWDVEEVVLR